MYISREGIAAQMALWGPFMISSAFAPGQAR